MHLGKNKFCVRRREGETGWREAGASLQAQGHGDEPGLCPEGQERAKNRLKQPLWLLGRGERGDGWKPREGMGPSEEGRREGRQTTGPQWGCREASGSLPWPEDEAIRPSRRSTGGGWGEVQEGERTQGWYGSQGISWWEYSRRGVCRKAAQARREFGTAIVGSPAHRKSHQGRALGRMERGMGLDSERAGGLLRGARLGDEARAESWWGGAVSGLPEWQ